MGPAGRAGYPSYEAFLLALVELEAQKREENAHQKRLRLARFPVVKTLNQFNFTCVPSLNQDKALSLAQIDLLIIDEVG